MYSKLGLILYQWPGTKLESDIRIEYNINLTVSGLRIR